MYNHIVVKWNLGQKKFHLNINFKKFTKRKKSFKNYGIITYCRINKLESIYRITMLRK